MDQLWAIRQLVDPPRARVSFVNCNDFAVFGGPCTVVANEGCFFCRLMQRAGLLGRQSPVEAALVRITRSDGQAFAGLFVVFTLFISDVFCLDFDGSRLSDLSLATRSAMSTRTV